MQLSIIDRVSGITKKDNCIKRPADLSEMASPQVFIPVAYSMDILVFITRRTSSEALMKA